MKYLYATDSQTMKALLLEHPDGIPLILEDSFVPCSEKFLGSIEARVKSGDVIHISAIEEISIDFLDICKAAHFILMNDINIRLGDTNMPEWGSTFMFQLLGTNHTLAKGIAERGEIILKQRQKKKSK